MRATAPPPRPDRPEAGQTLSYRWTITILIAASLLVAAVVVMRQDSLPWVRGAELPPARPLSAEEATRLANMRQLNWQDARAGVRATVGDGAERVHLAGLVDWRRPMVYLARTGATPGTIAELVQAVPGLVAVRAGDPAGPGDPPATGPSAAPDPVPSPTAARIIDPYPVPPLEPPADGWRLRLPGEEGPAGAAAAPGTIDSLAVLLLTVAAEQADVPELLAETESQWLRRERVAGYEVDVLLGPAIPPTAPQPGPPAPGVAPAGSLAALGGAVQYWLDGEARLHRLDALLAANTPVRVDLDRDDGSAPAPLAMLGGAAIDPRPVTRQEAEALARLRIHNREAGGGEITLTLPAKDGGTITGTGWLDWQRTIAYLALDQPAGTSLLWADGTSVGTRDGAPGERGERGQPPLPVPMDGWQRVPWESLRATERDGQESERYELDLLVNEALSLSAWERDDPGPLRDSAAWLRADRVDGTPVGVYEIPREIEAEVEPGEARLRYWIDESGVLRRLEIRTRSGSFAQLDVTPGTLPAF
jgi:hypothetical protein